ncbi:MAG: efflux transporter outer membrane subunit [Desulfarculaceae bacterium]|nr:efflux transporter outer membrane subunit [Desulfarculaceae bacterium]
MIFILLSGCANLKGPSAPAVPEPPERYGETAASGIEIGKWWRDFESAELNRLVASALEDNFSLKTARARLRKAKAAAQKAKADFFPSVNADADASYQKNHTRRQSTKTESVSPSLAASYEIDLWNRIDSGVRALDLTQEAARKDLEAAAVTVAAQISNAWIDLVAARERLALSESIERQGERQLEVLKERYKNGIAKGSDVFDQQKALESIRSDMVSLEAEIAALENRLVFLTASSDTEELRLTETSLPTLPHSPDTGIPADLLELRPDVKAAGLRLAASVKELEAAGKEWLPKLSISSSLSFQSEDFSIHWQDWLFNLAANLTAPVFDGGRIRQEIRRSAAARDEALHEYAGSVFEAVKEVREALIREKHQKQATDLYRQRLKAARAAVFFAELEYRNGSEDYVSYIERWTSLKNLEQSMIVDKSQLFKYRISLYRALGNTWTKELDTRTSTGAENEQ